jgi:hypothetical protein
MCTDASVELIQASSYDQTCTVDSDCVGIAEGNLCDHCDCVNAAINVRDEARYQSDNSGKVSTQLCKCPTVAVACDAGTCGTSPFPMPSEVGGPDAGDADADTCPPSGCTGSCLSLSAHNVSTVVDGCVVWQCCVPDDAGADAATDAASEYG